MPTLAEIRAKYPQYNDMDDAAFAGAFHQKFYSDMPREEFDAKLGLSTDEFVGPDKITRGSILPLGRNERTGEVSLALPQSLDNIYNLATGKTPIQEADPITGEVHSSLGAIKGGMDTAMTVAGAPPAKMAVEKAGGLIPKLPERAPPAPPKRPVIPASEWEMKKTDAYKAVDDLGARYSSSGYDRMVDNMETLAKAKDINPELHKNAWVTLETLKKKKGSMPSLTQLDQQRQIIRRDVQGTPAEQFFGDMMIDSLDDFIATAGMKDMVASDPKAAADAILAARKANATWRKTETLEDAFKEADLNAAAAGSGGNIDNARRQAIKRLLNNKKKIRFFTKAEKEALTKFVEGDSWQNTARLVGKLSPEGNGLMMALQLIGGYGTGGASLPLAGVGWASKRYAEKASKDNFDDVLRLIQGGGQ
jgi:hypothetical protein